MSSQHFKHFAILICLLGFLQTKANEDLQRQMMEHVEKILVVDTINVGKYEFFKNYRLQPSTGKILTGDEVAAQLKQIKFPEESQGKPFAGFTNEFNDYMIWSQEDTTGYLRLAESVRLIDGQWSVPEFTPAVLNTGDDDEEAEIEANAAFPFMLDDGQTLYFASDNENSLGGYDIFIVSKDPADGEFLIPGNLGMPFNSPYDDYLMVLDRQTGVGWWASDRNQLDDEITIYIYALSDERVNVDPEDEDLITYATLSGWQDLIDEEQHATIERFRKEIAAIKKTDDRAPEFLLQMPGGKIYRYFSDFKNKRAAGMMQSYLRDKKNLESKKLQLASLRKKFNEGSRQVVGQIENLEQEINRDETALQKSLSSIYQTETAK